MKLLRYPPKESSSQQGCVATVGNFDGLHRGHQLILQAVQQKAAQLNLLSTLISFEPLPGEYFSEKNLRVYPLRDKVRLLKSLGLEQLICLGFNEQLANMPAEVFVHQLLLQQLKVKYLLVGDDFCFGYQRQGNYDLLKKIGIEYGMQVQRTETYKDDGERISSTRLRNLLQQADLTATRHLLGYHYRLSGRVRHGDKRGRTIGFPTLNLKVPDNLALRKGVYAVYVYGLAENPLKGVANLGTRPTVNGLGSRFEIHVFDFHRMVYGEIIEVEPRYFIRPEQRFDSLSDLQACIEKDRQQAQSILP